MKAIFVSFNQAYYEMILNVMDRNNIRGLRIGDEERQIGATLSGQRALYHGMHRRPDRDASGRRNVN